MLDHQLGFGDESAWNTPVVVDEFVEWIAGNGIDWDPEWVQGNGLRVGSQVDRVARRVAQVGQGTGKIKFDLMSVGCGKLIKGLVGTGASADADSGGGTYQETFALDYTGTYPDPFTLQEGLITPGGTAHTYTYAGCSITEGDIECPESGVVTATLGIDARSLATNTALATASYPAGGSLFTSALPTTLGMQVGGTLTVPTSTAVASTAGGTGVACKSWKLSVKNNLDTKRRVLGGRKQPTVGKREAILTATVEYDNTTGGTFRDAYLAQTSTAILLDLTTDEALNTGTARFQVVIPAAKIDKGPIPMPDDGMTITTSIDFKVLDNLTDQPLYLVRRTAETAL